MKNPLSVNQDKLKLLYVKMIFLVQVKKKQVQSTSWSDSSFLHTFKTGGSSLQDRL